MVIRIIDHVRTWSSYSDGDIIYRLVATELRGGKSVGVSFFGIKSVPSAFVNAALIRLLEEFSFQIIRTHLTILDSTRQINRLVKDRFTFAAAGYKETAPAN